jgi:ATP-dependent Clp protease ATP-binding subunit ClpB
MLITSFNVVLYRVGKTELCKALAQVLFDDDNAMTRIDMSEYGEKHTVSRLIGVSASFLIKNHVH